MYIIYLIIILFNFFQYNTEQHKPGYNDQYSKLEFNYLNRNQGYHILENRSCIACHSTNGSNGKGPTFKGLYGSKVKVLTHSKEREIKVDEKYIIQSIRDPRADIVEGYEDIMPVIEDISDKEIYAIIDYLKLIGKENQWKKN